VADLFDNPLGLDGFEFIEFCAPIKGMLEPVFAAMGFAQVAHHRSKDVQLWRQGGINLIANYEKHSPAWYFAAEHGASACGMGWRVKDAATAYAAALERGAEPVESRTGPMELRLPGFRGIGGSIIYLIDRYGDDLSIYDIDFVYEAGAVRNPVGAGLQIIDHLTHNVYGGRMAHWAAFYERIANFREIRWFDIKGEYTGLTSKAMTAPDGKIRIPLNEESRGGANAGGGQIEEFLRAYNGEGIQHIAFSCDDLVAVWDRLKAIGTPFMTPPPATYYEMLAERLPGHGEPVAFCSMAAPTVAARVLGASCCRFFPKPWLGRCSSNSSSARATKALAKAISRRCSKAWSAIRSGEVCCRSRSRRSEHPCSEAHPPCRLSLP
jgi:4-hydroxyphenylpyruvate dioxygenase